MQDSSHSVPSLEAARLAVLGPSYSGGALRPSSATSGKAGPLLSLTSRARMAAQHATERSIAGSYFGMFPEV